jgi:O-antigen ligase
VLGMLVVLGSGLHVFHEEIFLAVPLGAYLLCGPRLRWWQAIVGLALIGACLVSVKNTTFLLVLLVLAACFGLRMVRTIRRSEPLALVVGLYFGIPALVASVAGLYYAWKTHRQSLPSGNVEYRVEMYGIAWRRFLDSPIWGNGFTESSVNYFELYRVATKLQTLPTHSDILDLMAHGGLLALLLWLMGVWLVAKITWGAANRISLAGRDEPMRAWRCVVVLGLVQLCAIVTYAFNPPLISPVHAYWMWGSAAVMWALNQYLTEREPKLAVEPRKAPARVALA